MATMELAGAPAGKVELKWLSGPWADLAVGCGLWSLPLLLAVGYLQGVEATATYLGLWFYGATLLCNYPHYFATIYRVYGTRQDFNKYRFFTIYVTVFLLLTAVLTHFWRALLPWFYTIYIMWSPWHYTGQNFGLAMMFARRNGSNPGRATRNWLYLTFVASFLMWFVIGNAGPGTDPMLMTLKLSKSFADASVMVLSGVFVLAMALCLRGLTREAGWRRLTGTLALLSTQFLWFVVPSMFAVISPTKIPPVYIATGILAFMHCAQYLWVTGYFAKREWQAGLRGGGRLWNPLAYYGLMVVGGIALWIPGPWVVSRVFHYDLLASVLTFQSLINLHHFLLDGAIWKLRDGVVARFLLGTPGGAGQSAVPGALDRFGGWVVGRTPFAKGLRVVFVVFLIGFALFDQTNNFMMSTARDLPRLDFVSSVNPHDTRVIQARAAVYFAGGFRDEAIALLRQAVEMNPYNGKAQRELLRMLTEAGKSTEALEHHARMEARFNPDAATLVYAGVASMDSGDYEEALKRLHAALDVDENQAQAYLFLGTVLKKLGRHDEAVGQFEKYLEVDYLVQELNAQRNRERVMAMVNVGECHQAMGRTGEAEKWFRLAAERAETEGEAGTASQVWARLADMARRGGRADEAIELSQQAVRSAIAGTDPISIGTCWLNYADLLWHEGYPDRLTFACYVKAEAALKGTPFQSKAGYVEFLRNYLEGRLGAEASAIRRDLSRALEEALAAGPAQVAAR